MADTSHISWTDATFNPWIGCTRVSPACDHCYAATWGARFGYQWDAPPVRTSAANWKKPLQWDRQAAAAGEPRFVFCASLADVFDNRADPAWRADLMDLIRRTPNLTWLLLTKRIGNVSRMVRDIGGLPSNVWLGATIANQEEADRDIAKLIETEATKRFLSMEPLLGPVDLSELLYHPCPNSLDGIMMDPSTGAYECCNRCDYTGISDEVGIDWVIVGGESGSHPRAIDGEWVRSIRDQCRNAGVAFHFKQWGEFGEDGVRRGTKNTGRTIDGVIHDARPEGERA